MIIPSDIKKIIPDVSGKSILEYGDKFNQSPAKLYKHQYINEGASYYVSVDINGNNGALPIDLRDETAADKIKHATGYQYFDIITNIGTSEHVTIQKPFWLTTHLCSAPGTIVVNWVPVAEKRLDHAKVGSCWHPYPEFFVELCSKNKYDLISLDVLPDREFVKQGPGYEIVTCVYQVGQKQEFVWDDQLDSLMWRNPLFDSSEWHYEQ